ncbi:MAG: hypothetical protein E7358_04950 [Clostridiales bacterium]|nr:hypothetical protein [Clostridiales bacterium]
MKKFSLKKIIAIIAICLVVIISAGLVVKFVFFNNGNDYRVNAKEIEYNKTFGVDFKQEYPSENLLAINTKNAPFAYADTSLFSGKRITKIDIPVSEVISKDAKQYFTIYTVKSNLVKVDGSVSINDCAQYKIYIPESEITSVKLNKWISIDLSSYFIFVEEDETLAFFNFEDPVICGYSNTAGYDYIYNLSDKGQEEKDKSILMEVYTDDLPNLSGKKASVIGDSISTFEGVSNNVEMNSTIGENRVHYPRQDYRDIDSADKTWWGRTINSTGMDLCVNNSWSGSRVFNNDGAAYQTRCTELHNNQGEQPDVIFVYMGLNDFAGEVPIGSFKKLSKVYKNNAYIEPTNFAEAYAIMIHKMKERYKNADIFVMTSPVIGRKYMPELLGEYNQVMIDVANYFECPIIDLANYKAYSYVDCTVDGSHPNQRGMDIMADLLVRSLKAYYA